MQREITIGRDGKEIVHLIPETEEDIRELERMIAEKRLRPRDSFADDPAAWQNKTTPANDQKAG